MEGRGKISCCSVCRTRFPNIHSLLPVSSSRCCSCPYEDPQNEKGASDVRVLLSPKGASTQIVGFQGPKKPFRVWLLGPKTFLFWGARTLGEGTAKVWRDVSDSKPRKPITAPQTAQSWRHNQPLLMIYLNLPKPTFL